MFFYLPCPFQTTYPNETPPVFISGLLFPKPPSLPPALQRKTFSSPKRCRLFAAGGRTPGFALSLWTAVALCRSTESVCLQVFAETAWRWCLFLSPSCSLYVLPCLLSARLTFLLSVFHSLPQALLPYLFNSLWLLNSNPL